MSKSAWEKLGYSALAVMTFVSTLIVIRWTIDFVSWSGIDSGGVQAVGSIAALGVAIFVMSSQSKDAIKLVADTDLRALKRKASAIEALMSNARNTVMIATGRIQEGLDSNDANHVILERTTVACYSLIEARNALATVPLHELGSGRMVIATLNMMETLTFLNQAFIDWRAGGPNLFSRIEAHDFAVHMIGLADVHMNAFTDGVHSLGEDFA